MHLCSLRLNSVAQLVLEFSNQQQFQQQTRGGAKNRHRRGAKRDGSDFCWEQLVWDRGVSLTHTSITHTSTTHTHTELDRSAIAGLRGWHSWQCQSTLGTSFLFPCQSQPTLITFKFTKLYWQDERSHCCSLSCRETKLNADLCGSPIVPVQVYFNVKSENVY